MERIHLSGWEKASGERRRFLGHFLAGDRTSNDMTRGPIAKSLLMFTLPILLSQLLQQFYNIADTAMVGQLVGADALAAVGSGGLLLSVAVNFYIGLSAGISVVISQLFGMGDYQGLKTCVRTVMVSSGIMGLVFTGIGLAGTDWFLRWLATPEEILPLAAGYLRICLWGMAAQLLYNVSTAILRALGNTVSALYYLLFSSACNLVLDAFFMMGCSMGIRGAALATVISQYIACLLAVIKLCRMGESCRLELSRPLLDVPCLWEIFRKGVPAGLQAVFMSISSLVIQTCINSFGYSAMAGMTVYAKVEGFLYFPLFSFGIALTSFIGQNTGAKRLDRVRQGMRISLRLTVLGSVILGALLMALAPAVLPWFTGDEAVLRGGLQAICYIFPLYWLYAVNQVYIGVLRGMGHTFYPMVTSLLSYCFFRILWCRSLDPLFHDMRVVYTAYDVSWVVMAALLLVGYRFCWRRTLSREACADGVSVLY